MAETLTVTLAAVIFGNFITVTFLYALWRLGKNDRDAIAIVLALFCAFTTVAIGFGLREALQAEKTTPAHSSP